MIQQLSLFPDNYIKNVIGKRTNNNSGLPKALLSSDSNEWYTPKEHVEAARALMRGEIDLDPASNELANRVIKANKFYTIGDNGYNKAWYGNVWLNPPYGRSADDDNKSNQELWSAKLISEYKYGNVKEAVLLVNAVTDRRWFQPLWDYPICFTDHRIKFYSPDTQAGQPTHGNALVYFGNNLTGFVKEFKKFGVIAKKLG